MKFFMPHHDGSSQQQESAYVSIREFLAAEFGAVFSERRIRSLAWWHDGKHYSATVGEHTDFNGESVIAILYEPQRGLYHVCTPNRGAARGGSILAGEASVTMHEDFETNRA